VTITYSQEPWSAYRAECEHLWARHHAEVEADMGMEFRPREEVYTHAEAAGALLIIVARNDGEPIGYAVFVIQYHTHHADVLCGFEDRYYLLPDYRKGWAGVRLIGAALDALRERGVQRWYACTKVSKNVGPVLRRLGGVHTDELYSGRLN
jgi:GNAT superfamily N-acetyltransferase